MSAKTIEVPRELFEHLVDYSLELKSEWLWKKGERNGNAEEFNALVRVTDDAVVIRDARLDKHGNYAVLAYWLEREDCPGRIYAGATPCEVAETLRQEIINDDESGLPADEVSTFRIVPYETTLEEIANLPEFGGW